eukprot:scaffold46069_cov31-Tisochrysis_lutea.AAC.3
MAVAHNTVIPSGVTRLAWLPIARQLGRLCHWHKLRAVGLDLRARVHTWRERQHHLVIDELPR